jgi:hypothetical protein
MVLKNKNGKLSLLFTAITQKNVCLRVLEGLM